MAPFDNFYGLGGADPTTNWGQNVIETTMQQFGGQAGGQQPKPAYVPPPADFNPPQQHYVAPPHSVVPPSNERSHEQYLMDLQNEREAEYSRNRPPPAYVPPPVASPSDLLGPNPAIVDRPRPTSLGGYARYGPPNRRWFGGSSATAPAAQQAGGAPSLAAIPEDELKFRQSLVDQGHFNAYVDATTLAPHTYSPFEDYDWALQAFERFQNPNLGLSQGEIYALQMLATQASPVDYLTRLENTVPSSGLGTYWNPR